MDILKYSLCTTDTHPFCYVCSQPTVGPMALSIFYQKEPRLRLVKVTSSYRINYNLWLSTPLLVQKIHSWVQKYLELHPLC